MKSLLICVALMVVVAGCERAPAPTEQTATAVITAPTPDPKATAVAPAQFSYDAKQLPGRFSGTLPCAACPGIDAVLELTPEGTYTLDETFRGDGDGEPLRGEGTWTVDDAQVLLLDPNEKAASDRRFQLLSHDELRPLDADGHALEGEQSYRLLREAPVD